MRILQKDIPKDLQKEFIFFMTYFSLLKEVDLLKDIINLRLRNRVVEKFVVTIRFLLIDLILNFSLL